MEFIHLKKPPPSCLLKNYYFILQARWVLSTSTYLGIALVGTAQNYFPTHIHELTLIHFQGRVFRHISFTLATSPPAR